jgi:hypothetical protein
MVERQVRIVFLRRRMCKGERDLDAASEGGPVAYLADLFGGRFDDSETVSGGCRQMET